MGVWQAFAEGERPGFGYRGLRCEGCVVDRGQLVMVMSQVHVWI